MCVGVCAQGWARDGEAFMITTSGCRVGAACMMLDVIGGTWRYRALGVGACLEGCGQAVWVGSVLELVGEMGSLAWEHSQLDAFIRFGRSTRTDSSSL
jgi:hypothetical protein